MAKGFRFGRRIALPSTVQILHEFRVMDAQEEGRKRHALADGLAETSSWEEIGAHRARARAKSASTRQIIGASSHHLAPLRMTARLTDEVGIVAPTIRHLRILKSGRCPVSSMKRAGDGTPQCAVDFDQGLPSSQHKRI